MCFFLPTFQTNTKLLTKLMQSWLAADLVLFFQQTSMVINIYRTDDSYKKKKMQTNFLSRYLFVYKVQFGSDFSKILDNILFSGTNFLKTFRMVDVLYNISFLSADSHLEAL